MTIEPRFRPRTWMANRRDSLSTPATSRWGWLPLSLIFRRLRAQLRKPPIPPGTSSLATREPTQFTRLERHIHHHTHEGARLITGGTGDFVFAQVRTETLRTLRDVSNSRRLAGRPDTRIERNERTIASERITRLEREVHSSHVLRERTVEQRPTLPGAVPRNMPTHVEPSARPAQQPVDGVVAQFRRQGLSRRPVFAIGIRPGASPEVRAPEMLSRRSDAAIEHRLARSARPGAENTFQKQVSGMAGAAIRQTVPIVWRSAPHAPAMTDSESPTGQSDEAMAQPTAPSSSPRNHSSAIKSADFAKPGSTVLKLDGPVLDKLAEDVMQRIDRRMRIERERRGM